MGKAQTATFFATDGATTIDPDGGGPYFERPTSTVWEDLAWPLHSLPVRFAARAQHARTRAVRADRVQTEVARASARTERRVGQRAAVRRPAGERDVLAGLGDHAAEPGPVAFIVQIA